MFIFVTISVTSHSIVMVSVHAKIYTAVYLVDSLVFTVLRVFAIAALNICIIHKMAKKQDKRQTGESRRVEEERRRTIILILTSTSCIVLYLPVLCYFFATNWSQDSIEKSIFLVDPQRHCTSLDLP